MNRLSKIVILALIASNLGTKANPVVSGINIPDATKRFRIAIQDAKTASPTEISKKLVDITPWNLKIIWDARKEKVLVVSVMSLQSLGFYINDSILTSIAQGLPLSGVELKLTDKDKQILSQIDFKNMPKWLPFLKNTKFPQYTHSIGGNRVSWATVAPKFQEFIRTKSALTPEALRTAAIEKLGLFPEDPSAQDSKQYRVVVEQWIDPANLFRPSIDPEITDSDSLPPDTQEYNHLLYKDLSNQTPANILDGNNISTEQEAEYKKNWYAPPRYKTWYNKEQTGKYQGKWAMPWTRLGYTYDYSLQAFKTGNHFGLSEFCLKPYSQVTIKSISSLSLYQNIDTYDQKIKNNIIAEIKKSLTKMIAPPIAGANESAKNIQIGEKYNASTTLRSLLPKYKKYIPGETVDKYLPEMRKMEQQIQNLVR